MTSRSLSALVLSLLAACSSSDDSGGGGAGGGGAGGAAATPQAKLATDIAITEVALFQGPKVPLMKDGARIDERPTPVVIGREGLLRVYFKPAAAWKPRDVVVRLEIQSDTDKTPRAPLEIRGPLKVASTEEILESTANFAIPADALGGNARFAVSIYEVSPEVAIPGDSSAARWPAADKQPFLGKSTNKAFKVVIVPIRYGADGSNRVPDTSPAVLEQFRTRAVALYPTPGVEITVTDPLPYPAVISPTNGNDWNKLLQTVLAFRQSNGAASDVYYYGLVVPSGSEVGFCGGGCIAGLTSSVVGGPSVPEVRGSVGVGFPGENELETFVHELGHAQTLRHAPCSEFGPIQNVDSKYPYATGDIGAWGYDMVGKVLKPPTAFKDLMGYCNSNWISDYHYAKLATEMGFVSGAMSAHFPPGYARKWQVIGVDERGKGTLGVQLDVESLPSGAPREVTVLRGRVEQKVTGYFHPFGDIGGGLLLVPIADGTAPVAYRLDTGDVADR